MDFAVIACTKVKVKESEKLEKYSDLARERKRIMEHEDNWYKS